MANCWFYLLLLGALAACSTHDDTRPPAAGSPAQLGPAPQLPIPVSAPVLIDSSEYVMYPLSLSEIVLETEGEYGSSSSRETTYWNILFYNPRNNQYHLLSNRKLFIQSFTGQESGSLSGGLSRGSIRVYAADKLLYFSIVTTDFNHDGQLTSADPTYLFTSDKAGKNFRQISPDSLHVAGWEVQQSTGNVLIQMVQDSNHDRKFGDEDESIPYVYNLANKQPARRIFSAGYMKQLSTQFGRQWPKKP